MSLLKGKKGLIMGVANDRSIAWGIAKKLSENGAEIILTYQNDTLLKRVKPWGIILFSRNIKNILQLKLLIDDIKKDGGKLTSFKSFCGGLLHPDSDNNPWNYKFTWNPRNVVLAGKSGASYLKNGSVKEFDYNQVFSNLEKIVIPGSGEFESYANRDSLHYQKKYHLFLSNAL